MEQYSDYCTEFLQLTDAVTRASVRETERFLFSTSQEPERSDWTDVIADNILAYWIYPHVPHIAAAQLSAYFKTIIPEHLCDLALPHIWMFCMDLVDPGHDPFLEFDGFWVRFDWLVVIG